MNIIKMLPAALLALCLPRSAQAAPKNQSPTSSMFPPEPAKIAGRTTCNTRCINNQCWRTYDSGKKVKKYNPFSGQFEWDSGSC